MSASQWDRLAPLTGIGFVVLVVAGNALQGSTPALHGDADAVAEFYGDKATPISLGMTLSLISLFFLAWFLGSLHRTLLRVEGRDGQLSTVALAGGIAAIALLAAGFSFNAAGALRARENGSIPPETAAIFYDGSLVFMGLAATLAMAILLAPTAIIAFRFRALPRWAAAFTAVLAALGLVTPLSFILFLVFPVWILAVSVLLYRRGRLE